MSLVFSGLMPHSPLLIPNIGKENLSQFNDTLKAAEEMAESLEKSQADTIIVLSSKAPARNGEIGVNVSPHFKGNLEVFGDLVTNLEFSGNTRLCGRLRERFEGNFPFSLITEEKLDYASTIALSLLGNSAKKPIVPIGLSSELGYDDILNFALALQDAIIEDTNRIAIIASADLSHRVNKKSPLGYSAKGKKFDQKILEIVEDMKTKELADLLPLSDEVACEDTGVIIAFLSLLNDVGGTMQIMRYESPFGVGHLTAQYRLGERST